jgi:hypothetical protein
MEKPSHVQKQQWSCSAPSPLHFAFPLSKPSPQPHFLILFTVPPGGYFPMEESLLATQM